MGDIQEVVAVKEENVSSISVMTLMLINEN